LYKIKEIPSNLLLFLITFIFIEVYYFFFDYLFIGLYSYHGYTIESFSNIIYLIISFFLYIVVIISLTIIIIGFMNRKRWFRKYTILFIAWASIWPIWGIIIGNNQIINILILAFYIFSIYYLNRSSVKEYFIKNKGFIFKGFTLYKRKVQLKSGRILTIYFFSYNKPKSGTPCELPDGYIVEINQRSKLPYLKKKNKKQKKKLNNIEQKEIKETSKFKRKTANMIYVVSKPQPGQVKGDWAVRSHSKIYSHHRTKNNAIKAARELARRVNATVLIQNTNGNFSRGFKPRPK